MITLPESQPVIILTQEEFDTLFANQGQLPADVREHMRVTLAKLPIAARAIYCRENIADPDTPLITVIETVLYSFDRNNRERVADALGMLYDDFILFLVGYILGHGE